MRVAWTLLFDMTLKNLKLSKRQSKSCEILVKENTPKQNLNMCHVHLIEAYEK